MQDAQLNQRRWGYHALSAPKLFEAGVAMPDGWSPVCGETPSVAITPMNGPLVLRTATGERYALSISPEGGAETAPVSPVEAPPTPEPPKADPLDHDHDGKRGGSLPREKRKYTRKAR